MFIYKVFLFVHRILGALLSILFVAWFLSGLVMIYHNFPRVTQSQRLAKMDYLKADSLPEWKEIEQRLPKDERVKQVTLDCYLGQNVFHIRTDKGQYDIPARSGETLPSIDGDRIRKVASLWNESATIRIDTLYQLEQWIPFGRLKEEFPIYKFYFDDKEKHQLYISSKTGNVLQYTDKESRFWAWIGAIPHWVYFTSLRQDAYLWIKTVVWLSGIGCLMCIAGIYLGIRDFRLARKRGKVSPYKKAWYKWHHITGTVFGLFVLTFCFSGMMSLARVQDWGIKSKLPFNPMEELAKQAPSPADYVLDYREAIAHYPGQIRQLSWSSFGNIPYYTLRKTNGKIYLDARMKNIKPLSLKEEEVMTILKRIHESPTKFSLMEHFDDYYLARKMKLALPVYKIEIDDIESSTYYVDPKSGRTRYIDNPARWMHWMYPALHSLRIRFLIEHPVLWNTVMWGLMLGGTFVSISGLYLAFKYLKRKVFRTRKK